MVTVKAYIEIKKKDLRKRVEKLIEKGITPTLLILQVGDDPSSNSYTKNKNKDCDEIGIKCIYEKLCETITENELINIINVYLCEENINGVIVQLPLPNHINVKNIQYYIPPEVDVDGFRYDSLFTPCTPKGIIDYLAFNNYKFEDKNVVIIGRSNIVGKPLARLFTDRNANVTLLHSKTSERNLFKFIRESNTDLILTCTNKIEQFPHFEHLPLDLEMFLAFYSKNMDEDGAGIIDIGLGIGTDGKLCGNISKDLKNKIEEYLKKYFSDDSFIISGTGGVGLLTRISLLENVVLSAENYNE